MSLQLDRRSEELRLRVVRRPLRHDSSPKHVAGSATFVDDMREPEGLLHIAVGGAPVASGQLLGIDLDAVRAAPGVVAVLTAARHSRQERCRPGAARRSDLRRRAHRFSRPGRVRRGGEDARAGAPRRQARQGRGLRSARTASSVDDALAADSHILPDYTFRKDDSAAALAESAYRVKGRLRIGGQEHFYLEGQVSLAIPGEDGDMLIYTSTQHPSEMQHLVAAHAQRAGRRRHRRGAPHGRRVRRQGDAGRAMGRDRGARRARHRPAVQDPARPRRRHESHRQAARFPRPTTRSASTSTAASRRWKP